MDIAGAGIFIISTLIGLFVLFLMLRFLLRLAKADYYNPISQGIVSITNPVVKPVSLAVPSLGRFDLPTLLVAILVQFIGLMVTMALYGYPFFSLLYLGWAMVGVVSLVLNIYFFALIIVVIASWIAPNTGHPVLSLATQITEPLCDPARRLIPPMGGLDLSVMFVIMGLILLEEYLLVPPLAAILRVQSGLMIGL